ncbi:hypothetical protein H072_359 [Dactylellina haptotyla CBS 200.50]|uniref:DUF6594 domain-containing protein n=1 Tax=Dactylellina haptotyla (strain CBS 200.50) TaxID=1284197 RepID=S8AXF0_DACHA|nr:hypothetical protein H072_359 [Dactylellina haptotyla CBS 200.50]
MPIGNSAQRPHSQGDLESNPPEPKETRRKRQKYNEIPPGYSRIAAYVDGHEDAPIFRRFGLLKARVLLTQQAELEEKENDLRRIDEREAEVSRQRQETPDNVTWLRDKNNTRKDLVEDIAKRLRRYEKDMLLYRQMLLLPSAQKRQIINFENILHNDPLDRMESRFLDDRDDLIALHKESEDSIELWEPVSDLLNDIFDIFWLKIFKQESPRAYQGSREITVLAKQWMQAISRLMYGIIVTAIVTFGVILLYFVKTDSWRLVILCCATLLCAVLTSILTKAKKSEVFGVAAAYCAVLVVFVGSTLDNKSTVQLQVGNSTINGTIYS